MGSEAKNSRTTVTLPKSWMLELPVTIKGKRSIKHFVG